MSSLPEKDLPMPVAVLHFLMRDEDFDHFDQNCFRFNLDQQQRKKSWQKVGFYYSDKLRRIR